MLTEAIDMQQVLVLSLFQSSWFWFLILLLALFLFLYCLERRRVIREKTLFFASKSLFLFFFLLLLLLLLSSCLEVQKSDATEVIDMQEALEVSPTECYSSSVCVWPKVEGSQPHPTLFLNTDLLLTDASVRRAQLVLTIGSSQGGWSPCRGNIMIYERSDS